MVSFTSWVPETGWPHQRGAGVRHCPREADWDGLPVSYPRWPVYQAGRLGKWVHRNPQLWMRIGWEAARSVLSTRVVAKFKPDVVFRAPHGRQRRPRRAAAARYGVPFVVTDHDFGEIDDRRKFAGRRAVFERVSRRAFRMVAVASRMEQCLKRSSHTPER